MEIIISRINFTSIRAFGANKESVSFIIGGNLRVTA